MRSLTVAHGRKVVLRDVTFSARTGTLFWITGENGAGKSSLLRVLAQRAGARGYVEFSPLASMLDISFYAPTMGVPVYVTVRDWIEFNNALLPESAAVLANDDPLLPKAEEKALLTRLSTGEAKRFLLWSLLRTSRPFTFLDEPYEHLSPAAKAHLTQLLVARAANGVVVVATNQEVPDVPDKEVLAFNE